MSLVYLICSRVISAIMCGEVVIHWQSHQVPFDMLQNDVSLFRKTQMIKAVPQRLSSALRYSESSTKWVWLKDDATCSFIRSSCVVMYFRLHTPVCWDKFQTDVTSEELPTQGFSCRNVPSLSGRQGIHTMAHSKLELNKRLGDGGQPLLYATPPSSFHYPAFLKGFQGQCPTLLPLRISWHPTKWDTVCDIQFHTTHAHKSS